MPVFRHGRQIRHSPERLRSTPITYNSFKSMKVNIFHCAAAHGPRIALQRGRGSSRKQSSRKEQMVDIILLLMAIASAISLLVVTPRDLQRKAILALRECEGMELSHARGPVGVKEQL